MRAHNVYCVPAFHGLVAVYLHLAWNRALKVPACKKNLHKCITRDMQLVKQQGDNKATLRRSRGGLNKFRKIRLLTVVTVRFLRSRVQTRDWFRGFHAIFRV
jgi:hypothetical protein